MPAVNEADAAVLHQNSFTVSPSPQPHQLDPHSNMRQRVGSAFELTPVDARSSPHMIENSGVAPAEIYNHPYGQLNHATQAHPHQPPSSRPHGGSLGVDFTGYQMKHSNEKPPSHTQPQGHHSQHLPPVSSFDHDNWTRTSNVDSGTRRPSINPARKRSHSASEQSSPSTVVGSIEDPSRPRLSSISQILNKPQHSSTVEEIPVDPHLSTLPPHLRQHRQPTPMTPHPQQIASAAIAQGQALRAEAPTKGPPSEVPMPEQTEKMSRLKREADQMRELLRSKEREIQEMERGRELKG